MLKGTKASMNWKGSQEPDMDEAGSLTIIEPDLALEKKASAPTVGVGDSLAYTVTFYHSDLSHVPAYDVDLEDLLPQGSKYSPGSMRILSGPAASTDGSGLRWHFSCIDLSWNASQKIVLRYNATCDAKPGETITNNATLTWTSLEGAHSEERTGIGGVNDYLRRASAKANAMRLSITKRAQPDPVGVGEPLTYTLTYENEGAQAASNVTITDMLDPGVSFLSSDPAPLTAANNTWKILKLLPDGPHSIEIKARVSDRLPNGTMLENRFSIASDEIGKKSGTIYTEVLNQTRLSVSKSSLQKAVRQGEEITYTIKICNTGGEPATNVTVRDIFDSAVEIISVWPAQADDGSWRFPFIGPEKCMEIGLIVRVPRVDVKFESSQNVRGNGFVNSYRDLTTTRIPYTITNRVYVVCDQMQRFASTSVKVLGEDGTDLSLREHGSGFYENRDELRFLTENQTACGHPTLKDGVCFGPHALTPGFMESRNRRFFVAQIPLIRTIESLLSVSPEIP